MRAIRVAIALLAAAATAAGEPVPTATLYRAYAGANVTDVSLELAPNLSLTTAKIGVFDLVAAYTVTPARRFIRGSLLFPGDPPPYTGSGRYPGLDPAYGCDLDTGEFTDAASIAAAGTMNTGNIGNATWLSNWDGNAAVSSPGWFLAEPRHLSASLTNFGSFQPPAGPFSFTLARVRVNYGSQGVLSFNFGLGTGLANYVANQWQVAYIPEASTFSLLAVGGLAFSVRRRGRRTSRSITHPRPSLA